MKYLSRHPLITTILSLVVTLGVVSLSLYTLTFIFYTLDPTCESFMGEKEQLFPCSFDDFMRELSTMIILIGGIPFLSICLYPFSWVTIDSVNTYRSSHKKTIFPEMRKKFFRLGFSCVVSLIISFIIISLYNSYLIDTLHLIEGGIFSSLILLIWPLSYYWIYRLITNKVAKIK